MLWDNLFVMNFFLCESELCARMGLVNAKTVAIICKMDRDRLTITLRKDVLAQLDSIIDGVQIRNRSHAIEYILSQSLGPKVTQAVILAGGQGVEMRPLTYEVPKALIPVGGKPVVEYALESLRDSGVRDIIIAIGHLGEKIKEALGNGSKYGVRLTYSEEGKDLGSAGALKHARGLLHTEPFVVMNGDILADINLNEVVGFHKDKDYMATMVLTVTPDVHGYGMVQMRGERVVKFLKKDSEESSQLVNAGVYVFNENVMDTIENSGVRDFEDLFPILAEEGQLAGFIFEGHWFEVSTPKNYERAIKEWGKK